jgi:hypothetical protein
VFIGSSSLDSSLASDRSVSRAFDQKKSMRKLIVMYAPQALFAR